MKWVLRFIIGFSYITMLMSLGLLIRPENASRFWASVRDLWPSVAFVTLVPSVIIDQLPPTEVGGLFLSSVVERLKADSLPKDSVL